MKTRRPIVVMTMMLFGMAVHTAMLMAAPRTTIRIYRENEGENGYSDVRESHITDYSGNIDHALECHDPGAKKCKWLTAPAGRLIEYAEDQILDGILAGTYQEVFNFVLYRVQWTSIGSRIEIQETQEELSSIN